MTNSRLPKHPTEDTPTPQGGLAHAEETKSLDATKSLPVYRLTEHWIDLHAEYGYTLEKWQEYDPNHSCYSCYDDWKKSRQKCSWNGPRWDTVTHGDRKWAEAQAKHYGIDLITEDSSQVEDTPSRPGEHKKQELERDGNG